MMNWFLLVTLSIATYVCISFVGYLTNASSVSVWGAIQKLFDLKILALILISNIFFVSALYYGFLEIPFAITVAIIIGVITSFIFSVMVYGVQVSFVHGIGLFFTLIGIYLLR